MPSIVSFDVLAIHQAIVDTLTAGGIGPCYRSWRDLIDPPCIVVVGAPDGYLHLDQAFQRGKVQLDVTLAMFGQADTEVGQEQIMRWLSFGAGANESVIDALQPIVGAERNRSFGLDGVSFAFGATRYATSVIYPEGSNSRYALGELDLQISIGG